MVNLAHPVKKLNSKDNNVTRKCSFQVDGKFLLILFTQFRTEKRKMRLGFSLDSLGNIRCPFPYDSIRFDFEFITLPSQTLKGQFPVNGIFRAGGIFDNRRLLSHFYLFIFRVISSPTNNRISNRSENFANWKLALRPFNVCPTILTEAYSKSNLLSLSVF